MLLLRPDIVCADSTDVPTVYWRVNSSSLDGALLLDFITQGPSYEPFIQGLDISIYGFPNSC